MSDNNALFSTPTGARLTLQSPAAGNLVIGDGLIVLHPDGTVTGRVDEAEEAAKVFMTAVRMMWGGAR